MDAGAYYGATDLTKECCLTFESAHKDAAALLDSLGSCLCCRSTDSSLRSGCDCPAWSCHSLVAEAAGSPLLLVAMCNGGMLPDLPVEGC